MSRDNGHGSLSDTAALALVTSWCGAAEAACIPAVLAVATADELPAALASARAALPDTDRTAVFPALLCALVLAGFYARDEAGIRRTLLPVWVLLGAARALRDAATAGLPEAPVPPTALILAHGPRPLVVLAWAGVVGAGGLLILGACGLGLLTVRLIIEIVVLLARG